MKAKNVIFTLKNCIFKERTLAFSCGYDNISNSYHLLLAYGLPEIML